MPPSRRVHCTRHGAGVASSSSLSPDPQVATLSIGPPGGGLGAIDQGTQKAQRSKTGCWTCRFRRKSCPNRVKDGRTPSGDCDTCYGEKRTSWMTQGSKGNTRKGEAKFHDELNAFNLRSQDSKARSLPFKRLYASSGWKPMFGSDSGGSNVTADISAGDFMIADGTPPVGEAMDGLAVYPSSSSPEIAHEVDPFISGPLLHSTPLHHAAHEAQYPPESGYEPYPASSESQSADYSAFDLGEFIAY
ncbi:hypothetical protein DL93DRAFT_2097043 [Clavulina sp. PMI_390]|nr:hypothetical protein DL93DRAFT_2097043 [Clavulina sp. PMI_390]